MKTQPITPARIAFDGDVPVATAFGDVYHARAGALAQAQHVFLQGNQLPARWAGRARFVVLETGFGLGHNFLATWAAWRDDPRRCERLVFVSVEKHPPTLDMLRRVHQASPLPALAGQLAAAWPPLTHNLHPLDFESGRVRLLLAFGDVADWLPELVAEVDAFYLDGFAPAKNPQMWERRVFKALGRLAAPGATAATWSVARVVRDGLAEAGFSVERAPGFAAKGEMSVARYAPAFTPRRAPSRLGAASPAREAVIIGAGLAGAGLAAALQAEGVHCTVIDRHHTPAAETSGNPAGLFHGVVTPEDGAHARFNRAAALLAQRRYAPLLREGLVPGRLDGLLRLQPGADAARMQASLDRLGLPPDYVHALTPTQAAEQAGVPLQAPAWCYPGGGWLSPAHAVRHALQDARCIGGRQVAALRRAGDDWQALDHTGQVIAQAPVMVLANAADALRLLGHPGWPVQRVRGQVTLLRTPPPAPRLPLAGTGYAVALPDGRLLCGATHHADDDAPQLRDEDHQANLAQLSQLLGTPVHASLPLEGRVGWRFATDDRLPVLGPVPLQDLSAARLDQPRFVPREPGLYTFTALGSRGITWAPLAAQALAAWISGAPLPLEAGLLDAVDVARFASRAARRPQALQRAGSVQPPPSAR